MSETPLRLHRINVFDDYWKELNEELQARGVISENEGVVEAELKLDANDDGAITLTSFETKEFNL